ncbi:hypothetical protein GQ53DRAFT_755370 [Thozetella sp. PMI_491]|nr:hypothetical protein GQ53DRAFT_755370 [Thozetella sp. PMI_491]
MRILCLHGRGSNNDIFKMQTAGFRSLLDDYEFDFVQGQMPHVEGNWSLHTNQFANSQLWGYFNMLDAADVLETERQVLEIARDDGPYDGILGYSQGATLAAQTVIRHILDNPECSPSARPFRFAIFFNGATPSRIWEMAEEEKSTLMPVMPDLEQPLALRFLHAMKANPLLHKTRLFPAEVNYNGRGRRTILTDGKLGMTKLDAQLDGNLINIPTLHVRCPDDIPEHGEELYNLCDPALAQEYFHIHKHDFPRGYDEIRQIARFIRSTAELSQ